MGRPEWEVQGFPVVLPSHCSGFRRSLTKWAARQNGGICGEGQMPMSWQYAAHIKETYQFRDVDRGALILQYIEFRSRDWC